MAFDLEWSGKSGEGAVRTESMVLRMEPPEAIVETSRLREFEIPGVAGDVVPVPPCYWVDAEGAYLPHPALISGLAAGTTKPAARPSTQGTGRDPHFRPELRPILDDQIADRTEQRS